MVTLGPTHLTIVAKAPVPGQVKTRMSPPCSPEEAAGLAAAALADTLAAAMASGADRVVVALDGPPGEWIPPGIEVIAQADGPLGDRLERIWMTVGTPGFQIGMDTPQLTSADLDDALERLTRPDIDATLGLAHDGGWWGVGFARPAEGIFYGVPMSHPRTGRLQLERLTELGLRVDLLPTRRDADDFDDAMAIAAECPGSRFAQAVDQIRAHRGAPG